MEKYKNSKIAERGRFDCFFRFIRIDFFASAKPFFRHIPRFNNNEYSLAIPLRFTSFCASVLMRQRCKTLFCVFWPVTLVDTLFVLAPKCLSPDYFFIVLIRKAACLLACNVLFPLAKNLAPSFFGRLIYHSHLLLCCAHHPLSTHPITFARRPFASLISIRRTDVHASSSIQFPLTFLRYSFTC